jgi:hypothetical protein
MKKCNKCSQEKSYLEYYKNKACKDGYNNICIFCRKILNEEKKTQTQQYYKDNKEKYQLQSKKYYKSNTAKVKQKSITYQKNNPIKSKESKIKWQKNNREYFKKWQKNKWNNDPLWKIRIILGNRLNEILKKNKTYKTNNIIKLLGCSLDELKSFISSQLISPMSWDNHGEVWEIDHIKPCSSFDFTNIEHQKECFHYTNLQPLFKTTEIAKSFGYFDQIGNRNKNNK